jgi:arginine N-succinyltransferase
VYVPLLPEEAQWAIGQLHPVAELPFGILLDEGFDADSYVDIFDGGPTADARLGMLKTVRRLHQRRVSSAHGTAVGSAQPQRWQMVATAERNGFRATLCPDDGHADTLAPSLALASALEDQRGPNLWCARLDLPGEAA